MRGFYEPYHLRYIPRIYLTRIYLPFSILETSLAENAFNDGVTLLAFARSYTDIPQNVVILRTFVRRDMRYCSGSNNKHVRLSLLFHMLRKII